MPRKARQTIKAVNGEEEQDTREASGRFRISTPQEVAFRCHDIEFRHGIGRTDDEKLAKLIIAEFPSYTLTDTAPVIEEAPALH